MRGDQWIYGLLHRFHHDGFVERSGVHLYHPSFAVMTDLHHSEARTLKSMHRYQDFGLIGHPLDPILGAPCARPQRLPFFLEIPRAEKIYCPTWAWRRNAGGHQGGGLSMTIVIYHPSHQGGGLLMTIVFYHSSHQGGVLSMTIVFSHQGVGLSMTIVLSRQGGGLSTTIVISQQMGGFPGYVRLICFPGYVRLIFLVYYWYRYVTFARPLHHPFQNEKHFFDLQPFPI
jgi:hypothetical protein